MWKAGGRLATGDQERPLNTAISASRGNGACAGGLSAAPVQNLLKAGVGARPAGRPRERRPFTLYSPVYA
jgi:hypothetical protein